MRSQSCFARLAVVALIPLLFACVGEPRDAGEWAQWRGPGGLGVSPAEGLPLHWNEEGVGIRWQVEVPDNGISSPIVSGGHVFLTSEEQQGSETALKILSFDLETGYLEWATTVFKREREKYPVRFVNNSPAGPTPVTDGEFVYAYFGSHLAALDFDGRIVWLEEIFPGYLDEVRYGAGSSPVLSGDKLIVFRDREETGPEIGWLAAFDKETGGRVWKRQWDDTCCAYTTPLLVERESGVELIVSMAGRLMSYDPQTGAVRWRRNQPTAQPVASPVVADDFVCASSGTHLSKGIGCWRFIGPKRLRPLWRSNQGAPGTSSPIMYNGLLFTLTDKGVMSCYNPANGKRAWLKRLPQGGYHASLVAGDGKIYAFSWRGLVSVIAAEPNFRVLAESQLPAEGILASPAIAGGCLVVRSADQLLCVDGAGVGDAETAAAASP